MDISREELKFKLDECSDEIIKSIESTKENCIKLSKECKRLSTEIEKSKEELNKLIDRFDTFDIDEKKFEEIRQRLIVLNRGMPRKLGEYKDSMIGNKEYTFEFKEIDINGLFGSFKEVEKVILHLIGPYFLFILLLYFKDVRINYNGSFSSEKNFGNMRVFSRS